MIYEPKINYEGKMISYCGRQNLQLRMLFCNSSFFSIQFFKIQNFPVESQRHLSRKRGSARAQ